MGRQARSVLDLDRLWGRTLEERINPGTYESLLVQLGIQLPVTTRVTLQGEFFTGHNLDQYLGGIGQGINPVLGTEVEAQGGWVQALFDIDHRWSTSLGYGYDDPKNGDLSGVTTRTRNQRLFANLFYNLTDRVTLSGEYSNIKTEFLSEADVTDNRVQLAARYAF